MLRVEAPCPFDKENGQKPSSKNSNATIVAQIQPKKSLKNQPIVLVLNERPSVGSTSSSTSPFLAKTSQKYSEKREKTRKTSIWKDGTQREKELQSKMECGKFTRTFQNNQLLFHDAQANQKLFRATHVWDEKPYLINEIEVDLEQNDISQLEKWVGAQSDYLAQYITCWLENNETNNKEASLERDSELVGNQKRSTREPKHCVLYVQLAHCEGTSLREFLVSSSEIPIKEAFVIFSHILAALDSLHSQLIPHGNLR